MRISSPATPEQQGRTTSEHIPSPPQLARVTRASIGLRSERGPVLLAVMLSLALVAVEATVLATAVPAIVDDLGGLTDFPWLFSCYLLAQAVTIPVFGKLADLFGRKPVMITGVCAFLVGSLLCGFAWSMGALIAFRVVQGLGAGAIQPMAMTIVGDLYSVRERAKVQGYLASVWALSSVLGPTLGGVLADYVHWRWIFFINLPLGAVALWVLIRKFDERVVRQRHRVDFVGALLLAIGGVLLLIGLFEGGQQWAWSSPISLTLFAVSALVLTCFVFVERRVTEPVLPMWIFRQRILVSSYLTAFIVGMLILGLSSYVPLYTQVVLGQGAVVAGLTLATMFIGWPIAASISGRFYLTLGFRFTLLMGAVFALAGAVVLSTVSGDSSVLHISTACFLMGVGFGFVNAPAVVAAQSSVTWRSRGVVTATNSFSRSVGSAVGVAVFAAIVNAGISTGPPSSAADPVSVGSNVLESAVGPAFLAAAILASALLATSLLMPNRIEEVEAR